MKPSLKNITLWLTRPEGQARNITAQLKERGANVFHLPMLQIEALPETKKLIGQVKKLDKYDMAFFISTNAAQIGMELVEANFSKIPEKPSYFAPGPTTAKILENYELDVAYPKKAMSTEALLILPEIREILETKNKKKKKALIFRGKGGRELLANTLRAKGMEVDYIELYKRILPDYKESFLEEILNTKKPDGVIFSSAEGMQNFVALFQNIYPDYKLLPAFVSSERLKSIAEKLGFKTITVLEAADDESLVDGLEEAHE